MGSLIRIHKASQSSYHLAQFPVEQNKTQFIKSQGNQQTPQTEVF